jgi:hypothetical protein
MPSGKMQTEGGNIQALVSSSNTSSFAFNLARCSHSPCIVRTL